MQIKGTIRLFAILLALVCLFQLSFSVVTRVVEKKATNYSKSDYVMNQATDLLNNNKLHDDKVIDSLQSRKYEYFLDSISNENVYNLLVKKYTYAECKERELNLGLDLKGGMNVMMEVAVVDVIEALSGDSQDPTFRQAIAMATEKQKNSQSDFLSLFYESYKEVDPSAQLAGIFAYEFKNQGITTTSSNDEVMKVLRKEVDGAIDRSYEILRQRIDRFGVSQPNIQRISGTGRILIELPGVKDPERVRKLLQGTASLEFWETYKFSEIYTTFLEANSRLAEIHAPSATNNAAVSDAENEENTGDELSNLMENDSTDDANLAKWEEKNPLFRYLIPAFYTGNDGRQYPSEGASVGMAKIRDTAMVNKYMAEVSSSFPRNARFAWTSKPESGAPDYLSLVALKVTSRDGKAPLSGDVITDARQDYTQDGSVEVSMTMNSEGARIWKNLTGQNIDRQIAITLDNYVYSYPNVRQEIAGGRSSISGGGMTVEEAQDIANILKAGKLPAPARIIQEEVVGPSLGQQSINSGLLSFLIAFLLVFIIMFVYYNNSGFVADLALLCNIFFIVGILASIGAVLTLPGIAGIVLTIGMAVDSNVIIYERIREELRNGKGIKLAIDEGYKRAYSAIIDGNITTLITAIVLYIFGSGPVKGFATTLMIGILCSLFTSIFITRLIYTRMVDRKRTIKFDRAFNAKWFTNCNFDFVGKRRIYYIISGCLILIGIISLLTKGLSMGVDFAGGRSYVVRFDQDVNTSAIAESLSNAFGSAPEVKTFGPNKQVKITTTYKVEEATAEVENEITRKLYDNLSSYYKDPVSYEDFSSETSDKYIGILNITKVGPTIATDMRVRAYWAVGLSLIFIFIYIALRFRRWQFGLGGVAALAHDAFIAISCYSIFYGILPFSLDVDQSFIAAILTIIGYSINASVVIFDRVREYLGLYPKKSLKENINGAINSTLSRSVMSSLTTLVVLLVILFLGGESIAGMAFALFVGILVGTYSSVCISSNIAYDLTRNKEDVAKKLAKKVEKEAVMANNKQVE
ncbi:MAG: protein translocase subunit SecDF [Bacteroidales bacterium]|nr:protein translocase subunit SecDF [Bacteroidales bacterium]MBR5651043.1 protein translocase subunit SecDF [Bacteroidales bacterium]